MQVEQVVINEVNENTTNKPKSVQGKLNRLGEKAQGVLMVRGHSVNRFKRNYAEGTATYTCRNCGDKASLNVYADKKNKLGGSALETNCQNNVNKK